MEINELLVHKAILRKPTLIEKKLGIKLEQSSLIHHYPLSNKGEHIDFVFKDISGNIYLAEVKLNTSPISVIPQLFDHEYKKYIEINQELDEGKIFPVIIIDEKSVSEKDQEIIAKMNIKLCTYDLDEIKDILESMPETEAPVSLEFPELKGLEDFLKKTKTLYDYYGDINILLGGFRGESWWDGYYDFRVFWLWKDGNYPESHKRLFQMLCEGRKEDCIWFTFLTSVSDNTDAAKHIVFKNGWGWSETLSARNDADKWVKFEECLCNSGRWIQALLDHEKRKKVVTDYLDMVGDSQEKYLLKIMHKGETPFDAYNEVWKALRKIHNIGNVVAGEFATFLSQWRILPIIPSDHVREGRFARRALESLEIKQPMESHRDALLRLARKYSVAPIVIERAMHKLGLVGTEH